MPKQGAPIYRGIVMRKLADRDSNNVKSFNGQIRFETDYHDHKYLNVPTSTVTRGIEEGWITPEDGWNAVHRPGGPASDKWRVTHTFIHYPSLTFHTVDGNFKYKVEQQPDKYHRGPFNTDSAGDPDASVLWFYLLERVN